MRAVFPLVVAFIAAIVAFAGSTLATQRAAQAIDREARFIAQVAAPALEAVADTRSDMRLLHNLVVRRVSGERVSDQEISASRERLEQSMARALKLSVDGGTPLVTALERTLRDFDTSAERALVQAREGSMDAAHQTVRTDLRARASEVHAAATALVELHARNAQLAAERIGAERDHVSRLAWQLDAISAVIVIGAAFFALRAVRERNRAQERYLDLAQRKAAELEQFAGRVAHDVLSPLSTVGMAISIARRNVRPQAEDALRRGDSSLQRVKGIVNGLLEFARSGAQTDPTAAVAVQPVVDGLRDELGEEARQQDAELVFEPFEPCAVRCAPGVLISVLSNLLRNALKYLGDAPRRRVILRVLPRRDSVLFEVEDTGPGVPAGSADTIFEPYVRGRHPGVPGVGLGLATVRRLVQAHGGTVGVRNAPGGGALFHFDLPKADPPSGRSAAPEARPA